MSLITSQGRFLWAIGGKIEDAYTVDDTTVYSVDQDRWHSSVNGDLAPMPHAVQGAGWNLHKGRIYSFGGKTKAHTGCSAFVQMCDIAADTWTILDEMPAARSKLGKFYPVFEGRYVFLFGGDDAQGRFHRVNWNWRYDLETGSSDAGWGARE